MTAVKKQNTGRSEFWQLLKEDRMAMSGLLVFVLFFVIALTGLLLTTGQNPVLDPSLLPRRIRNRSNLSSGRCSASISSGPMIWDGMFSPA